MKIAIVWVVKVVAPNVFPQNIVLHAQMAISFPKSMDNHQGYAKHAQQVPTVQRVLVPRPDAWRAIVDTNCQG